eukprot:TRINITY_DN13107_c0_g1_i1.p1 TRINITY_DN13107_c0_g1~~TRINITY_DN13107_c0_g1_i1.p1  ORF type:complete len:396 (+),score=80.08 TRINITY_DN13107_c0_g1_i1:119-1306(+)
MEAVEPRVAVEMEPMWPDRPPPHVGPILFVEGMVHRGGGRGVIAMQDIAPGTLLVAERPYLAWPTGTGEETLDVAMVTKILRHKRSNKLLKDLTNVHPVSVADIPDAALKTFEEKMGAEVDALAAKFNRERSVVLRLFMVLQMSAHGSGLYLYLSLFNHNDRPNSIKFTPTRKNPISEIRATQFIVKGEEVTVSYLEPREQTTRTRRLHLENQFAFDPNLDPTSKADALLERFQSTREEDAATNEAYVTSFEQALVDISQSSSPPTLTQLLSLRKEAIAVLDMRHLLLLRLHKLIMEAVAPLVMGEGPESALATNLIIFISTAFEIYKTQLLWLTKDHIDFATTYNDLAMGLGALLQENRTTLFATFPQWNTVTKVRAFISKCQSAFERIDGYYQ